jgi:lysophospholipase L1-like esterase
VAKEKQELASSKVDANLSSTTRTADVDIEGREHLESFFKALRKSGAQPVRVMHYGDSTLAGDGIAKTVRRRMKAAFGDAGPGFFVAGMDPRWMRRDDVRIVREGDWDIHTILFGGNQGRYGLGGVVAKSKRGGHILVTGPKVGAKLGQRVEIYTHKSGRNDAVRLTVNGAQLAGLEKISHSQFDQWVLATGVDVDSLKISIVEPGLEVYGAVIEGGQGVTWETTAVVGVASGSVRQFNSAHLADQTAARRPELIVIMLGGNETGHPGLLSPDGATYKNGFSSAVRTLKQGAPQAACLIMSPLDQGVLADDGQIYSRKVMPQMVKFQREVSQELGCAFWDSWQFMGGRNSFSRWLQQGLAWTDLVHLTDKGLTKIGNGFGDALLAAYQQSQEGR